MIIIANNEVFASKREQEQLKTELKIIYKEGGRYICNKNDVKAIHLEILDENKNLIGFISGQTAILLNYFLAHSPKAKYPRYESIADFLYRRWNVKDLT